MAPSPGPSASRPGAARGAVPLAPATAAATKASLDHGIALRWNSKRASGELPADLLKNTAHVAIYLLPRTFASLGLPMAAEFATLWQYGRSSKRQTRVDPPRLMRVVTYRLAEFGRSPTLAGETQILLKSTLLRLPELAGADWKTGKRWNSLLKAAENAIKLHKGKDVWEQTSPDFELELYYPNILVDIAPIVKANYELYGEEVLHSDAFASFGNCAARAYLQVTFRKKPGQSPLFVSPLKVGVRVGDDYDFKPASELLRSISPGLARLSTQFLGIWWDDATNWPTILTDDDFVTYRNTFAPAYNEAVAKKDRSRQLICEDFVSLSDFLVIQVTPPVEYQLLGLSA